MLEDLGLIWISLWNISNMTSKIANVVVLYSGTSMPSCYLLHCTHSSVASYGAAGWFAVVCIGNTNQKQLTDYSSS